MKFLRWILLLLYLALVVGLLMVPGFDAEGLVIVGSVTVVSLGLFIYGTGTKNLCRPVRKSRLVLPVLASGFMLTVLVAGLTVALSEFFRIKIEDTEQGTDNGAVYFWGLMAANWVIWSVLLFFYTRRIERFAVLGRLAEAVFAGSLAELLAAIPAHLVVIRRPGCLVGIATMLGVVSGVYVMCWSFGPAIALLFLYPRYVDERRASGASPERQSLQFHLKSIFVLMLAAGVLMGLAKLFWQNWFVLTLLAMALVGLAVLLVRLFVRLAARKWQQIRVRASD